MDFQKGDKIKIIEMQGEPQYTGKIGIIDHIDDIGQLHGTWGGCAVIPEADKIEVLEKAVNYENTTQRD